MRILEISRIGLFKSLLPDSTKWIRWGASLTANEPVQPERLSIRTLNQVLRQLSSDRFDLLVLPAMHTNHHHDQSFLKLGVKMAAKSVSHSPIAIHLLNRMIVRSYRHIILDINDTTEFCKETMNLFPRYDMYFKRELDISSDIVDSGAARAKPISLFVPDDRLQSNMASKDIDVFFAGNICSNARKKAIQELQYLRDSGFIVYIPADRLSYQEYLRNLSRSWIVLSPEGYGWDCYRHYEAGFAGSVPLINYPSYRRNLFFREGIHCVYYNADTECVANKVRALLKNKADLLRIGAEARRHVLRYHTRSGVARSILERVTGADSWV